MYYRLKGFSEKEIESWTLQDLYIVDTAIQENERDNLKSILLGFKYHNYTNQTVYKSNGKVDELETEKLRKEAERLYNQAFDIKESDKVQAIKQKEDWQKEMMSKFANLPKANLNKAKE